METAPMIRRRLPRLAVSGVLFVLPAVAVAGAAPPVVDTFEAVADTSLFESGDTSNGAGTLLFAGVTGANGGFSKLRSPMRFDLSAIPADADIIDVQLTVTMVQSNPVTQGPDPFSVRRILAPWGEAGSEANNGQGAPAQDGDATWNFSFFPGTSWTTPGGDLAAKPSAALDIGTTANSTWTFTGPQMVADVAAWIAGVEENHGWALMADESIIWTARKFGAREGAADAQPVLVVTYEVGSACPGDLDGSGAIDFGDLLAVLANFGDCVGCPEDLDESGAVDFNDLLALLANFGGCLG
jgi:hypothetical protein